jgi:cathepsin A (carboxypeptidase C)
MIGLFFELGPSRINDKIEPVHNPHAWNNNASVIFLEQPVGVGYSYGSSGVDKTEDAAKDIYALLSLFFHQFPEYSKQHFHLAGESYGGHYVPAFTAEILSHQPNNINLKSASVGNGLSDTLLQYPQYKPFACDGAGGYDSVLDQETCDKMEKSIPRCNELIERCYATESSWMCVPAYLYCTNAMVIPYTNTGRNPYDIRDPCQGGEDLCYAEITYATKYLNREDVIEAIGSEVHEYGSCNWKVNREFMLTGDWMKPYFRLHTQVLETIPTLIYAGDADFICNWLGIHEWTENLDWPHREDFQAAEFKELHLPDEEKAYGRFKTSHNLTFLQLFEAGHLVPHDTPEAASDMINRWLQGEWWA